MKNIESYFLPTWTTGSYFERHFSSNVSQVCAFIDQKAISLEQLSTHEWRLSPDTHLPENGTVKISWRLFAYSNEIHRAYIDNVRGFINPACAFLLPKGPSTSLDAGPIHLCFTGPLCVFTALPTVDDSATCFQASSFDLLLDTPFTLIDAQNSSCHVFDLHAHHIAHKIVITGVPFAIDSERLLSDFQKIFETTIDFWADDHQAPFTHYLIHLNCISHAFGGLEHRNSTALLCDPLCLPSRQTRVDNDYYSELLRLVAHEYFHAWLVKRLLPQSFIPYDLSQPCYCKDLWIYEGFTSLYETLIAQQANVITAEQAAKALHQRLQFALGIEGFEKMALTDASFNAWVKLYIPSQDTPYTQVSYYSKGMLLAVILNDLLQSHSQGTWTLHALLKAWFKKRQQRITAQTKDPLLGLADGQLAELIYELTGLTLHKELQELTTEPGTRPYWLQLLEPAFKKLGFEIRKTQQLKLSTTLGLRLKKDTILDYVPTHCAAFRAGLFAGDELVAINTMRIDPKHWEEQLAAIFPAPIELHYFRHHQLQTARLETPQPQDLEHLGYACLELKPIMHP